MGTPVATGADLILKKVSCEVSDGVSDFAQVGANASRSGRCLWWRCRDLKAEPGRSHGRERPFPKETITRQSGQGVSCTVDFAHWVCKRQRRGTSYGDRCNVVCLALAGIRDDIVTPCTLGRTGCLTSYPRRFMLSASCWPSGPLAAPNGRNTDDGDTMVVMLMSTDEKLR